LLLLAVRDDSGLFRDGLVLLLLLVQLLLLYLLLLLQLLQLLLLLLLQLLLLQLLLLNHLLLLLFGKQLLLLFGKQLLLLFFGKQLLLLLFGKQLLLLLFGKQLLLLYTGLYTLVCTVLLYVMYLLNICLYTCRLDNSDHWLYRVYTAGLLSDNTRVLLYTRLYTAVCRLYREGACLLYSWYDARLCLDRRLRAVRPDLHSAPYCLTTGQLAGRLTGLGGA